MSSAALLCVARVARTRFYVPPGSSARGLADPVVTSEPGALRFESFSACCGVHARFDVLPDGLDAETIAPGTVNVDFNEPMRAALARVVARTPLRTPGRLRRGRGGDARSLGDRTPRPAPRPLGQGVLRGSGRGRGPRARLRAGGRRRPALPAGAPEGTGRQGDAVGEGVTGRRPAGRAGRRRRRVRRRAGAPARTGARGASPVVLRAYAVPDEEAASVWVAELPGARLLVTLSPHFSRGFSGEGGLLEDLADDALAIEAEFLDRALHGRWRFTDAELTSTGLDPERGRRALSWLGAQGRIGFDPVERVWFRRELPFPSDALAADPPRLRDAKQLVQDGAVRLAPGGEQRTCAAVRRRTRSSCGRRAARVPGGASTRATAARASTCWPPRSRLLAWPRWASMPRSRERRRRSARGGVDPASSESPPAPMRPQRPLTTG